MTNILDSFARQNRPAIIRICFWITILLGLIDYLTGPEILFSIFYLIPIFLAAWFAGLIWSVLVSLFCSIIWFMADSLAGHIYSHAAISQWATYMHLGYFLIVSYLVSTVRKMSAEQKRIVHTDYLTDVANSRSFHQLVVAEFSKARRHNQPLTIVYIDIDDFKKINELFGFSIGDKVLKLVAQTIVKNIRSVDLAGRLGGDEFGLLLPELNYESAQIVMEKLKRSLLESMKESKWSITFSIGAITYAILPDNTDDMIINADHLMYTVKNSGKNAIKHELVTK
jgi:diguanylate cyclase (GGDEF)-like protein